MTPPGTCVQGGSEGDAGAGKQHPEFCMLRSCRGTWEDWEKKCENQLRFGEDALL